MADQQGPLTVSEAQARVKAAVDELEEAINKVDGTPGKKDRKRACYTMYFSAKCAD